MSKAVYIFLADGYEPLEALAPMDVLTRAKVETRFVSVSASKLPPSTQGYGIQASLSWDEFVEEYGKEGAQALIFPGGLPGADTLGEHSGLMEILREHFTAGKLTCAICAAPGRVLAKNLGNKLRGRRMTVYGGFENELTAVGAVPTYGSVCVDGNLITAQGPGWAIDFGLAILKALVDHRVYEVVKSAMML